MRAMAKNENKHLKDALSILVIILMGLGFALTFLKRARSWEFGILALVAGIILFYIRYYSDWMKEREIKMVEEK